MYRRVATTLLKTTHGKKRIWRERTSEAPGLGIRAVYRVVIPLRVDPNTKAFLANCMHPVFGFPTFIRFSWSTIPKLIQDKHGAVFVWLDLIRGLTARKEDLEDEDSPYKRPQKKHRKEESVLCLSHHVERSRF